MTLNKLSVVLYSFVAVMMLAAIGILAFKPAPPPIETNEGMIAVPVPETEIELPEAWRPARPELLPMPAEKPAPDGPNKGVTDSEFLRLKNWAKSAHAKAVDAVCASVRAQDWGATTIAKESLRQVRLAEECLAEAAGLQGQARIEALDEARVKLTSAAKLELRVSSELEEARVRRNRAAALSIGLAAGRLFSAAQRLDSR